MFCLLPKEIKNELQEKYDKLIPKLANVNSRRNYLASRAFNYIGGKSEDVSRKIISNFTEENDVVYDPCFGSGTFIISAALEGRKAIGVELDNYTYNMVKNLLRVHNKDVISKLYDRIDVCHFDSVMNLYETRCCGHQNYIFRFYFDPETENYYSPELHRDLGENAENIKLVNKCPVCDSKYKKYSKVDAIKLDHIECMPVDKFPSHKLIPNSRINITPSSGNDKYDSTFQRRSKIALLRIQRAIDELPDCKEKEFLQFALVSALTLSRTAQYGSSSYYLYRVVKRKAQESNVWIEFNKKFEYMLRYQGDYLADIQQNDLNNLTSRDLIKIINDDCKEITLEKLGIDKQVDLIYTDPPYTEQVPYLERHQLYRDWLREFYSDSYKLSEDMLEKEIVMTDSPIRKNKNGKEQYFKDIRKMFSSCYDLLKDYGIMVMHINLAKKDWLEIYNRFRNQARAEGFEPIFRYDIKNNDPTLRKQSSSANTSSFEIILFLVKLTDKERFWYSEDINLDRILYFIIKDFLHDDENLTKNRQDVISECVQFFKVARFN
ncbi:DNA methyltransferase [Halonatronum saccharophilum]|uniref:DNA methyltransferase n=1 Tax=Halonatronum saccharophilum TaxID=150060 RepID=UPI0004862EC1|nr:DNA methyltransferase [Halonatronum saccharophilum]